MEKPAVSPDSNAERSVVTHKTPARGVSEASWLVAEVKPTRELTTRNILLRHHYEAYVPCEVRERVYKNYTRRTIERPVIPGIVFVRLPQPVVNDSLIMELFHLCPSIYRFMLNRLASSDSQRRAPFALVTDSQLQQLRFVCEHAENPVLFTKGTLRLGDAVRVGRGPLMGLQGFFMKQANATYVVIRFDFQELGYVMTEVPLADLQPV